MARRTWEIPDKLGDMNEVDRAKYRMLAVWLIELRKAYAVYKRGVMRRTGCREEDIKLVFVRE